MTKSKKYLGISFLSLLLMLLAGAAWAAAAPPSRPISIAPIGTYETGIFDEGAAEIAAYDADTYRLFVINANDVTVDILDLSDPTQPSPIAQIDATAYGDGANSVAVYDGLVAVAIEADDKTDPGSIVFFDTDGNYLNQVTVGALPDMVTFSPNGSWLLVANEGEPNDDYTVDPEGSVSVIDIPSDITALTQADVRTADFTRFNHKPLDPSIRVFGPGATVAQDMEPEYIAFSTSSRKAWVVMQENNALAEIDVPNARINRIFGLGFKDHSLAGNGLDASDRDEAINVANWPVYGMYMPDAVDTVVFRGRTYILSANEGDARDYDGFAEEERVKDLDLDPTAFPNADDLQEDELIGRLTVTTVNGDMDNDGDYDALFAFGARSFSVWSDSGRLVYDSGDDFEQITAVALPDDFNSGNDENDSFDSRSDNKGPEPEGIVVGKIRGRSYAFIGLERVSGVMVYDVTNPRSPIFLQYINNRDFSGDAEAGTAGDLGPEGLLFIGGADSPTGAPLLVVTNEISGSTTVYEIND